MMKTKRILIITGAAAALLLAAVLSAGMIFVWSGYSGDDPRWIYVPKDATADEVKGQLGAKLGAAGRRAAFLWSRMGGDASKAHGAYLIKPGESPLDISRTLKNRLQTPVKLTFNNMRALDQLASRVASRMEADSAAFMAACDAVLPSRGFKRAEYPAAFLPDTYEFYWTTPADKIVTTLADYRDRFWNDERRAKAKALGLTPVKVATVASIAEEETNNRQERGVVARLYLNRVWKGMPLQADPTIKFALGNFGLRRITGSHLGVESPYNTYRHAGLPPGPIRIAEAATLDAVLDSKPHNYLYMCAKEDFSGRHNFAADYASHLQNAKRYHRALNRRNIK